MRALSSPASTLPDRRHARRLRPARIGYCERTIRTASSRAKLRGRFCSPPGDDGSPAPLLCRVSGLAREPAPLGSGQTATRPRPRAGDPSRTQTRQHLALKDCDHRIADMNGEQYRFRRRRWRSPACYVIARSLFSLWHPADCIGEVGAATLPAMLAMLAPRRAEGLPPWPALPRPSWE